MKDLLAQADLARKRSDFKRAEALYRRAARAPQDRAEGMLGAGDCGRLLGQFRKAVADYEKAIVLLRKADDERQVDAMVGLALSYRGMGYPDEALSLLKHAELFYTASNDPEGLAFIAWALGGTLRIAGDMKQAKLKLNLALKRYQALKQGEGVAYVSCALGGVERMLGNYGASRTHYRFANSAMRKRHDTFGIAYSYCGLGNTYRMHGDHATALDYFKKAEKVYATIGDKVSYAYTVWSMGTAYKLLSRPAEAKRAFLKCSRLFKQTGDPRGLAYAQMGLAELRLLDGKAAASLLTEAAQNAKAFGWESLHVKWLQKKAKDSDYKKFSTRFKPVSLPVNWP